MSQMRMKKRYLFFLRHYNDVDNITPAIYYYLQDSERNYADIVMYDQYDYQGDINLAFLLNTFPDRVRLYGLHNPVHVAVQRSDGPQEWTQAVELFLAALIQDGPPVRLAVFDINRTKPLQPMLAILRKYGVRYIVALPVCPLINVNVMREYEFDSPGSQYFECQHDYSGLDAVAFVDAGFYEHYEQFHDAIGRASSLRGKVTILGSLRYTPEWLALRPCPKSTMPSSDGRTKLLLLLSHSKSNVNQREVELIVNMIRQFPEYDLVIKSHPRDYSAQFDVLGLDERGQLDSGVLIEWADVVLFWSTSVAIEGYLKNKMMVCLAYVVGNLNLFSQFDAGYIARCRDDLYVFLHKYRTHPENIKYNNEGIDRLKNYFIPRERNIAAGYLNFMAQYEAELSEPSSVSIDYHALRPVMDDADDAVRHLIGYAVQSSEIREQAVRQSLVEQSIRKQFDALRRYAQTSPSINRFYASQARRIVRDQEMLDSYSLGELAHHLCVRLLRKCRLRVDSGEKRA